MEYKGWESRFIPNSCGTHANFKNFTLEDGKKVYVGFDTMIQAIEVREGTFEENAESYYMKDDPDLTNFGLGFMDRMKEEAEKEIPEVLNKLGFKKEDINEITTLFVDTFYS